MNESADELVGIPSCPNCGENTDSNIHLAQFFYLVDNDNFLQILLHLHEKWIICQIYSADFKYEVNITIECHSLRCVIAAVAALPTLCYVTLCYSPYLLFDTRSGKPITHLLLLPNFIALASSLREIFPFEI